MRPLAKNRIVRRHPGFRKCEESLAGGIGIFGEEVVLAPASGWPLFSRDIVRRGLNHLTGSPGPLQPKQAHVVLFRVVGCRPDEPNLGAMDPRVIFRAGSPASEQSQGPDRSRGQRHITILYRNSCDSASMPGAVWHLLHRHISRHGSGNQVRPVALTAQAQ